jgi:hypothetical protein
VASIASQSRDGVCRRGGAFRTAGAGVRGCSSVVDIALLVAGRGRENQIAFLDDEQEEQPVDQAQQVLVVGFRFQLAIGDRLSQFIVGGMGEKAVGEVADGLLDGLGKAFADAGAGVEGILVVALDQAFRAASLLAGRRETCSRR